MNIWADAAAGALSPIAGARSLRSDGFRDRRWLLVGLTPIVIVAVGVVSALIALLVLAGLGRLHSAFERGEVSFTVRACVAVLGVLGTAVLVLWVVSQLVPALAG
ncbi:hypothetical protein ASG90_18830 [Nocardioides sp. Soil797]|nr:hypothetical protein ASG90_18830 [Nocardioides sp. Soil797]